MKKTFKAWDKKSNKELESIWKESLITFDTSALLGLYRVSPEISTNALELTSKLKERIFLTYHATFEFHRNRFNAIVGNYRNLKDLEKKIDNFESIVSKEEYSNFLADNTQQHVKQQLNEKRDLIEERKEYYQSLERNDIIYEKISKLFEGKVEQKPTIKELDQISKEGKLRYQKKIPPGYADSSKTNGNEYGDLIIWNEILKKAKSKKKSIIMISGDQKEDWMWVQNDKKIIGPRPELLEEIYEHANVDFTIATLQNFIIFASKSLGQGVDANKINQEFKLESIFKKTVENPTKPAVKNTNTSIITELTKQKQKIENDIKYLTEKESLTDSEKNNLNELTQKIQFINQELIRLQNTTYTK